MTQVSDVVPGPLVNIYDVHFVNVNHILKQTGNFFIEIDELCKEKFSIFSFI
jgi:hypothetical protein